MLYPNLQINEEGHLCYAGLDTLDMAAKYGTPLYLMDETMLRENCRTYVQAMRENFGADALPLFASKALSFTGIYQIIEQEQMGVDIVSAGELYTALQAGFPPARMFFHGNVKTDADILYALENGVGYFVVDNIEELISIEHFAAQMGKVQDILLRLTPGIDPHTFEAVNTSKVDCQFGSSIETGQAAEMVEAILRQPHVRLRGYHIHIGSQIFSPQPFCDAADIVLDFATKIRDRFGYTAEMLNLGGGFGVRYVEDDPRISIADCIRNLAKHIKARCEAFGIKLPQILMEPGRGIVANAGITLYTVGSVKTIRGYRNYVCVDGGMTDNPRYALYGSAYTVLHAGKANAPADFPCTLAGRCCESGALIQENIMLPQPVRGDTVAVLVTGAYNYSMASNYNRVCKSPIVMIRDGQDYPVVRRETLEDLCSCDL